MKQHRENTLEQLPTASSPLERFEEFLQRRGGRITQQQKFIVEQTFAQTSHFDADELFERIRQHEQAKQLGRATVYRVLSKLVEAGMLVKMDLEGRAVYERDYGYPNHDHLHCQKCGRLVEFRSDEIDRICRNVAREHGFRVNGHQLIVSGVCGPCTTAARKTGQPLV